VGRARRVLRTVTVILWPGNSLKAIAKPIGMPTTLAIKVEEELTFRETNTMVRTSASRDLSRRMAETKLSRRRSIGQHQSMK
jgi:hypothetical protein